MRSITSKTTTQMLLSTFKVSEASSNYLDYLLVVLIKQESQEYFQRAPESVRQITCLRITGMSDVQWFR
jgi:hypothetical protein